MVTFSINRKWNTQKTWLERNYGKKISSIEAHNFFLLGLIKSNYKNVFGLSIPSISALFSLSICLIAFDSVHIFFSLSSLLLSILLSLFVHMRFFLLFSHNSKYVCFLVAYAAMRKYHVIPVEKMQQLQVSEVGIWQFSCCCSHSHPK